MWYLAQSGRFMPKKLIVIGLLKTTVVHKIALIEDDTFLLRRLPEIIDAQPNLDCVLQARSLGEFFEQFSPSQQLDLILADVELSDTINLTDHLGKIRSLLPDCKIIAITGHNHPSYVLKALKQGANSFYLKGGSPKELLKAIQSTLDGGTYISPKAAANLLPILRQNGNSGSTSTLQENDAWSRLNDRERSVAEGLLKGETYGSIASNLNLSINTIRHYVKELYTKFGVNNKIQLSQKLSSKL